MSEPILYTSPVPEQAPSKKAALLALLMDLQVHTNLECMDAGGARAGARLLELRREGWCIETHFVETRRGRYSYQLHSKNQGEHVLNELGKCKRCGEQVSPF